VQAVRNRNWSITSMP